MTKIHKRYRANLLGRFTTKAHNDADPDHVTAETVRAPEDDTVTDAMVEAGITALSEFTSSCPRPLYLYDDEMRAALEAALAVKRGAS